MQHLVEWGGVFQNEVVPTDDLAVVRCNDDDRVLQNVGVIERGQHRAEGVVGVAHTGIVQRDDLASSPPGHG